jgi:integrase
MMGLYKRGGVWWMRFSHRDKQVRRSMETTNKRVAEKIQAKVLTQIAEGKWLDKPIGADRTLKELLERYMEMHSKRNKAQKSCIRDRSLSAHLNRYLGDWMIADISSRAVADYKYSRREEGAAPNTVNNELRLLSHAFNLAVKEWEWVDFNPVSRVTKERVDNEVERWLTHEEEDKLLASSPQWLKEIVVFALNTGLRQAEILDLTWDRVDLFRKTFTILEQKNRGKDTLPLNEQALNVLKERAKIRSIKSNLVFFGKEGTRLDASNLRRAFYVAIERAGIERLRFHDLRHTFATWLVQAGVDLYKVQRLMRHKTPLMTQRYAHHYPESLRDGVEVLDRVSTILAQSNKKGLRP